MKTKFISIAATLLLAASFNTASATDYYLVGDFNNWTNKIEEYKFSFDNVNNVYTFSKTFGDKKFKIMDENNNWYGASEGDPYWLTFVNYSIDLASPGNNLYVERECNYKFTISGNKLTISGFDIFVAGSFNEWNWGTAQKMTYNEDGSYTKDIMIRENTEFKFTNFQGDNRKYIGAVSDGAFHVLNTMYSNLSLAMPGENFLIQRPGRYTLIINSDRKLTVEGFPATPLYDTEQNNNKTLAEYNNQTLDVELNGRKLYKGNVWNTLCLPFDLSADQLADQNNPLYGVEIRTLSSSDFSNGILALNFTPATGDGAVTSITAGTPYIVRWSDNGVIENPVFKLVTISTSTPGQVSSAPATFKGTFDPITFNEENKNILYLGAGDQLYYPSPTSENPSVTIGAFRAYFELGEGITAGEPLPGEQGIKSFVLNFDDDNETTSIKTISESSDHSKRSDVYFTLDGRRLNDKPATAGLYIINGKKVVIK